MSYSDYMNDKPAEPLIPVDQLLRAYRHGIFPMAESREDTEIFWVEPKRRAIIPLDRFHASKSLRKVVAQDKFKITINRDFAKVINACGQPRDKHPQSWISDGIKDSYIELHYEGHAHSIECWENTVLVGGLYGVSFGQIFCGESMFSQRSNASKVALCWLISLMLEAGYKILDCQFMTDHLRSLGAIEIKQQIYLKQLAKFQKPAKFSLQEVYQRQLEQASLDHSSPGKFILQSLIQTS